MVATGEAPLPATINKLRPLKRYKTSMQPRALIQSDTRTAKRIVCLSELKVISDTVSFPDQIRKIGLRQAVAKMCLSMADIFN